MTGSVTAYEGYGVDAGRELERCGDARALVFVSFFQRVVAGKVDHLRWLLFDEYLGIPFYRADYDDWFAIFAVEDRGGGERKVTVMYTGQLGESEAAGQPWDGSNMDVIRNAIIRPRAKSFFR